MKTKTSLVRDSLNRSSLRRVFTKMMRNISAILFLVTLPHGTAYAQAQTAVPDLSEYKIKQIYVPPEKRPEVRYTLDQLLMKNVGGELPTHDGEQFQINLFQQQVSSADDAKRMVSQFLESLKSPLHMDNELRMNINATTAKSDEKFIGNQIEEGKAKTKKRLSGQVKSVSKASDDMLNELADELKNQAKLTVSVYRFDQYFGNTPIDNTAINVTKRNESAIVSMHGKFYNEVKTTNKQTLAAEAALTQAIAQLKSENKVDEIKGDPRNATVVLLPYEDGFKYVWKTEVTADGPYGVWIDAETGKVLQLLPHFFFDNANGLCFNPDPNAGTEERTFEVDGPSGGKYTLNMAGVLTLANNGGDGTSGIVQVNDDGSGTANFNQPPINGLTVERTNQAGYNGRFQQVNIYAHIFNERRIYMFLGSQNFGQVNVTFNGTGNNAFCCPPQYLLGVATTGTSTACGNVFNSAIDATVIAHEFGHNLNGLQYGVGGGSMTGAINEGLADFWADTNFNTDTFGGWWGHNCPTPVQSGFTPRQSEPLDIFPEHKNLPGASNEAHSAGQIISWAQWSSRQGMNDATGFGTLSINLNTIKAMTTAGIGVLNDGSDKSIHDSYLDLLKQLAPLYSGSRLIHKLLAGYARAGIFLAEKDAIIDIDHSYLNRNSGTGPTFTIWTGRDYTFNGTTVSTSSPPFNTQFKVEVANDEAFTTNPVSSGWKGGVVSGAGGTATWTLPAGKWNTLKAGDYLFYRVTTRDHGNKNIRQSWNPGNGFLVGVPVGKAVINGTGTNECSCAASGQSGCAASGAGLSSAMALLPVVPVGFLVWYRRRLKKIGSVENKCDQG
jgi:Zn-dependent metalloprotease